MSSRKRLIALIGAGIAIIVAAVTTVYVTLNRPQAAPRPDPVAATVPVALTAGGLPQDFSVGIVLTLGQSGEPGSEYNRAAQGAVVAAQRFAQGWRRRRPRSRERPRHGGRRRAAVRALAEQGASGVVVTSTGPQARARRKPRRSSASRRSCPTPNRSRPGEDHLDHGAIGASVEAALQTALDGKDRVLLVNDGGPVPTSVRIVEDPGS